MTQQKPTDGGSPGQPPALDRVAGALYSMNSRKGDAKFPDLPDRRKDLWRSVAKRRAAALAVSAKVELVPAMGQGGPHEQARSVEHFLRALELATLDEQFNALNQYPGLSDPDVVASFRPPSDPSFFVGTGGVGDSRATRVYQYAPDGQISDVSAWERPPEILAAGPGGHGSAGSVEIVREFPYAIGSEVLERERQFRIALGAFGGVAASAAALFLLFWLFPPAVGAVAIVAGWLPWGAVVGGLIMARRS